MEKEYQCLAECPWRLWSEYGFIVKYFMRSSSCCEILVSDFSQAWYQQLTSSEVKRKNALWNSNIEAKAERLLAHIVSIFTTSDPDATLIIVKTSEQLTIKSESKLSSLSFSWEFNLIRPQTDMLKDQLTEPLVSMVLELSRRQQTLYKIIANKDLQIADYKAEGVTLPRKYEYEQCFDERKFDSEMEQTKEFRDVAERVSKGSSYYPEFEHLYVSLMKRKGKLSAGGSDENPRGAENSSSKVVHQKVTSPTKPSFMQHSEHFEPERERQRKQSLERRIAAERAKKDSSSTKKKLKL